MTLQEAHELQRRELISLRAENKRLKKQLEGVVLSAEKESLEKQLHRLEKALEREKQQFEPLTRRIAFLEKLVAKKDAVFAESRKRWKLTDERCFRLGVENSGLQERISALEAEVTGLRARAERAEAEVVMLNGSASRVPATFENSSLPSSAFPFRKRIPNSRKTSGRKQGAQKGHAAHNLRRLVPTKEPVHLPIPPELLVNPDVYATGNVVTRQVVDLRICVDVTDYVADEFRSRRTGARLHAPFPDGVTGSVNYGPAVKSFAFLLNNYYNVPVEKTRQCIEDITRGVVRLSSGTVCNLSSAFSVATEQDRRKIFSLLTHADVLYSDATVSNINGKRKAVVLCTDKEHVLYQHFEHKGHEALSCTPVKDCQGTLVHDHERAYYAYGKHHQECIAHVLRYLVGAMENEPKLTWHKRMHDLLQKLVHITGEREAGTNRTEMHGYTDEYKEILRSAKKEYALHPPSRYYRDGYNLYRRMDEYRTAHLYFLFHPNVDCTNNISERCLRKFKRKQRQAVVLRSDLGGQRICDALTIIETSRMQHRNVFDIVEAVFARC